jgi:metal-responsive CopG/Arc/MetJ family transcriptional regulator
MKTAISVPDDVYQRAERLAKRERRSRSEVYSAALREYVARHDPDEVTMALDQTLSAVGGGVDPFITRAGQRALQPSEW